MYGLDFLGLPKYEDVVLREFPAGWALGAFAETFGDALPSIRKVVETGRVPQARIHLIWSDTHTFGDSDIPTIRTLSRRYQRLATRFPAVRFEISPFCEHNLQDPDKYLEIVKTEAPSCHPVNTPWKGAISRQFKNEVHGEHAALRRNYNYSFDGTSSVDSDVQAFKKTYKDAQAFYFWVPQFNGKKNAADSTPRPERQAWPTSGLIDSVIYLHNVRGRVELPANYLWKSHADQHEAPVPEPRASKPVLIAPQKANRFELVAENGQVIAVLPYYGPFADGRHRYYLGEYGYLAAEKAIRIQGTPVVQLCVNNRVVGKINPAFRAGSFRN